MKSRIEELLTKTKKVSDAEKYVFEILKNNYRGGNKSEFSLISDNEVIFYNGIVTVIVRINPESNQMDAISVSNVFISEDYLWKRIDGGELDLSELYSYLD